MIGTTVSHYRILEHLGGGGMGVVYKAEDLRLARTVALKFLPPEWSRDQGARERFLREARSASALDHPNICTIHEVDETDDGRLFIAMAFYDGETLKRKIALGRLSLAGAVDALIEVADGLRRAHEAGLVHRDLKPANVMLTDRGEVKIVDFGLAKLAGATTITEDGGTLGTVAYMSPEQVRAEEVDVRADLWSLGVVLYEAATGRRPFDGDNPAAVLHAILHDQPARLAGLCPGAPDALQRIVDGCLEKDRSRRYGSAAEVLADLRATRADLAAGERPGRRPARGPRTGRRTRLLIPLAAAAALVAALAVGGWLRSRPAAVGSAPGPPRVVVLPFENLGPPEHEYLADGITGELISRLAGVGGLHVISRTSSMSYKGTNRPLDEIGAELGVQYALEGTVCWEPEGEGRGRVRITPQLIDVGDDRQVWSERYDRSIRSIFEVQSEIAGRVAERLELTLLASDRDALAAPPTDDPAAYQAYLRGLQLEKDTNDRADVELAIAMYERAVDLDPGFAVAWARLSTQLSWLHVTGFRRTPETLAAARSAAERAVALAPSLPEPHWALGHLRCGCLHDCRAALEAFDRALEIRPAFAPALAGRAYVLRVVGRFEESTGLLEEVLAHDPRNPEIAFELSANYEFLRNPERAAELIDLAITLAPDSVTYYLAKVAHLCRRGLSEEARQVVETAPVKAAVLDLSLIDFDIIDRRYADALARTREFPEPVYVEAWGPAGAGLHALDECRCSHLLGDGEGVRAACTRALDWYRDRVRHDPEHFRDLVPGDLVPGGFALASAYLGRTDEAVREARRGVELLPVLSENAFGRPGRVLSLATIYAAVGEPEAAIDQLELLFSIPNRYGSGYFRRHPDWESLHGHPRFRELLARYEASETSSG